MTRLHNVVHIWVAGRVDLTNPLKPLHCSINGHRPLLKTIAWCGTCLEKCEVGSYLCLRMWWLGCQTIALFMFWGRSYSVAMKSTLIQNQVKKKYFWNTLKYFQNTLKYFQNTLKYFQNTLKYLQNTLPAEFGEPTGANGSRYLQLQHHCGLRWYSKFHIYKFCNSIFMFLVFSI